MGFWARFTIESRPGPVYLAIRDALSDAIQSGRLGPGRRLPSHRMMATHLGVSVGTVTRAYRLALEQGLISGEIGRGTFVSHYVPGPLRVVDYHRDRAGLVDLFQNLPVRVSETEQNAWSEVLGALRGETDIAEMVRAPWSEVSRRHRRAAGAWVRRLDFRPPESQLFDCPGVMSALCAIVGGTTQPHDVVAAPSLSHPLFKLLADQYALRLRGLPMDAEGIEIDAFESLCRRERPKLLFCAPTIHSPTTVTFTDARRRAIADLCERYDVLIVEDEHAAFLLPEPATPIAAHAPTRTFLVADVWMALSLGLRTTYVVVPQAWTDRMSRVIAATSGVTTPLIAEIAARWIESGTAQRLIDQRREELAARNAIALEAIGDRRVRAHPLGHHIWLELEEPWTADLFALRAGQEGIIVNPSTWFWVGHGPRPEGVRISLGNVPDRSLLRQALVTLDRVLDLPVGG